ncbi:SDR family NAD(P)-dependent oxidoreductase [Solilutibacter silvestris]|uniref:Short chain dehydrogenase n=1 Tax=Solilutibacter silvestris TaxID=1645665 RepID=A0A2K1Q3I0_9GAMM|nr:SDR family NAD(P)-dependent oxidoreductase [Lysobacter silvestris]PNS09507.1 short chain dehydrogenase [Lysobacter silvestris]
MHEKHPVNPPQTQSEQPGKQAVMTPEPETIRADYVGSGKLTGRAALVTGGDSGIGRAVAVHFAHEGADVAIAYLCEDADANKTAELVKAVGRRCLLLRGDLRRPEQCESAVKSIVGEFGRLDILVNNHGEQHVSEEPEDLSPKRILKTFQTNVFSYFNLIEAALPYMKRGSSILNTASIVAVRGHDTLLDYSATKGAILSLTFSLRAPMKLIVRTEPTEVAGVSNTCH